MIIAAELPKIESIYEVPQASRYLYITAPKAPDYRTVHRWVRKDVFTPEARTKPGRDIFINFEELVSLRMIVALRANGFSLQHVRKVHIWLVAKTGYKFPFALRDLWIDKTNIFVELEGLLSASRKGQYALEFIKEWLHQLRRPYCTKSEPSLDLGFERINGNEVASSWTPHPCVMLKPFIQFGSPCIEDTRIPTGSVWSMFVGGDSPDSIARSYGVPLFKVKSALEWEQKIADINP